MPRPRVFVTRTLLEPGLSTLRKHCRVEIWPDATPPQKAVLIAKARGVNGLVCFLTDPIDKEVIDGCSHLQVISQVAVGYDNIDVDAATARGIIVTNTPEVLTETTADFAFALLLAAARRVSEGDRYVRTGQWTVPWALDMLLGQDVHNRTLGIVGLGRIGQAVARRARGFGMEVLYADIVPNPQLEKALELQRVSLNQLLRESDFVSLHVPLTAQTRGMIGHRELQRMKPSAVLINTSRGSVVDQNALVLALKHRTIAHAGLDVFTEEPLPANHPLLALPNVTLTPHIASASIQTRSKMAAMAADNCVAVLQGRVPPNPVNAEVARKLQSNRP